MEAAQAIRRRRRASGITPEELLKPSKKSGKEIWREGKKHDDHHH